MAITLADVLPLAAFVQARPKLEAEVLASKRPRRVSLGKHLTFLFENRASVLWQVHEMCRVEHIAKPEAVQAELDAYNPLLPSPSELSATLLLEYDDADERAVAVVALVGLHEHLVLRFADGSTAPFHLDDQQYTAERVSSVQFARAPLSAAQRASLANLNQPVVLACTHPAYPAEVALSAAARAALVDDLDEAARTPVVPLPSPSPGVSMSLLGQPAPEFTLYNPKKEAVTLASFRGQKVVLAFYPGAFTGVCEKEMCTLRDQLSAFNDARAVVLGISVDSPFSNGAFAKQHALTFALLSDVHRQAVRAYGVPWNNFAGISGFEVANRAVFVVDESGTVTYEWIAPNPGVEPDYDAVKAAVAG